MTTLELWSNNSIGDDGAKAIAEALKVNRVLTSLNLAGEPYSYGCFQAEGAKAIAEALKVNPVLTELNLQNNIFGNAKVALDELRDAVKDRSRFIFHW